MGVSEKQPWSRSTNKLDGKNAAAVFNAAATTAVSSSGVEAVYIVQ